MPVVAPGTVAHTVLNFRLDMPTLTGIVLFQRSLDGQAIGTVELRIEGQSLAELLQAPPVPGKSRGDDITDCIYEYAIAAGVIQGSIA